MHRLDSDDCRPVESRVPQRASNTMDISSMLKSNFHRRKRIRRRCQTWCCERSSEKNKTFSDKAREIYRLSYLLAHRLIHRRHQEKTYFNFSRRPSSAVRSIVHTSLNDKKVVVKKEQSNGDITAFDKDKRILFEFNTSDQSREKGKYV